MICKLTTHDVRLVFGWLPMVRVGMFKPGRWRTVAFTYLTDGSSRVQRRRLSGKQRGEGDPAGAQGDPGMRDPG